MKKTEVYGLTLGKAQLEAIFEMARALHDYNRGVLSMLGRVDLAVEHHAICGTLRFLVKERDALIPADAGLLDPLPPDAAEVQRQIDETSRREEAAWAPVQALIDVAREALEEGNPGHFTDWLP